VEKGQKRKIPSALTESTLDSVAPEDATGKKRKREGTKEKKNEIKFNSEGSAFQYQRGVHSNQRQGSALV